MVPSGDHLAPVSELLALLLGIRPELAPFRNGSRDRPDESARANESSVWVGSWRGDVASAHWA